MSDREQHHKQQESPEMSDREQHHKQQESPEDLNSGDPSALQSVLDGSAFVQTLAPFSPARCGFPGWAGLKGATRSSSETTQAPWFERAKLSRHHERPEAFRTTTQ